MDVKSLRIGNYVNCKYEESIMGANHVLIPITINEIRKKSIIHRGQQIDLEFLKPIPLTEEWLLKFGFSKFPGQDKYDTSDFWAIEKKNKHEWEFKDFEISIKYVNQLQNLYFALTGQELEIIK